MAHTQVLFPLAWITRILIGSVGFAITASILRAERAKRHARTIKFHSKYLRQTSAVCFWCGPISSLFLIFSVIPGFCMFRFIGSMLATYAQSHFLSLYQLSRLHYCFSNQQTRTNNGYPFWVFMVMITIGIIIWILVAMLVILVDTLPAKCGYTNDFCFFYRYRERAILFDGDSFRDEWMDRIYHLWSSAVSVSAQIWDLVILLLCLFKIWKIGKMHKSKGDGVWDNVLSILHRIVIITVFYQLCALFADALYTTMSLVQLSDHLVIDSIVYELRTSGVIALFNVFYSFSIYLMMDHNATAYVVFLRFLRRFGLKYCCFCCCAKMVDQQIERWEISKDMGPLERKRSDAKLDAKLDAELDAKVDPSVTSTWFPNLSQNVVYKSNVPSVELSEATVTHIDSNCKQ